MKNFSDNKINSFTKNILFIIAITILMVVCVFKFDVIFSIISKILKVLSPIIWGLVIAYLLNPIMLFIEKLINKILFKNKPHNKASRRISVFLTTILALSSIVYLLYIVLPEITTSLTAIPDKISPAIENLERWTNDFLKNYPEVNKFINDQFSALNSDLDGLVSTLTSKITQFIPEVSKSIINIIISLKDFVLGIIVSVYLLLSKETLVAQTKKVFFALFSKRTCQKAIILYHNSNKMFSGFITGKLIDSLVIGILAFIVLNIMNMPYVVLISVIIGVTNVIPFFGPFIGAIPSGLLVLIDQPSKVIPFVIFVLVLQQFDGNILGPRILGDSTGLPAFWVLFAIFLGGGLFGFAGMLLGVPTFAVIYAFFRGYVETKLKFKKLPISTSEYKGNVEKFYKVVRARDAVPYSENDDINIEKEFDEIIIQNNMNEKSNENSDINNSKNKSSDNISSYKKFFQNFKPKNKK